MKRIFFAAAILMPLMFGCGGNENGKTEKKAKEYNPIVITTQTDLELVFDIEKTANGCRVFGYTNLPDSTRFTATLIEKDKVFAQNAEIFAIGGKFEGHFGVQFSRVYEVELALIDNEFRQTSDISKQLQLIMSPDWQSDSFGREIRLSKTIKEFKVIEAIDVINPPANYKPKGVASGGIENLSFSGINRYRIKVFFTKEISGDVLDKEIRYWLYYVYKKKTDASAINVVCFEKGNKYSFMNGYFAPYGEWSKAGNFSDYSKYKVSIITY